MVRWCVLGGCSKSRENNGVSLHEFPKDLSIAKKWHSFVLKTRKWDMPPDTAIRRKVQICSDHFERDCYDSSHYNKWKLGFVKFLMFDKNRPTYPVPTILPPKPESLDQKAKRQSVENRRLKTTRKLKIARMKAEFTSPRPSSGTSTVQKDDNENPSEVSFEDPSKVSSVSSVDSSTSDSGVMQDSEDTDVVSSVESPIKLELGTDVPPVLSAESASCNQLQTAQCKPCTTCEASTQTSETWPTLLTRYGSPKDLEAHGPLPKLPPTTKDSLGNIVSVKEAKEKYESPPRFIQHPSDDDGEDEEDDDP
ncbi:unnamed protein product, partial [Owenia fusiformis]